MKGKWQPYRRAAAVFTVAVAAVTLAACSAPTQESGAEKPSLLIWVDTPREAAAKLYAETFEDEVDVKIEVFAQADAQTKVSLRNQAGSGWPDVVWGNTSDVAAWVDPSNGFAAPLDDLVSAEVFGGYGAANDDCKFDDQYYCLKNDLAQSVLWYDTVLFDELGLTVPTTMEEYRDTALKLQGTGYVAGAIGDGGFYYNYLQSSGCPLSLTTSSSSVVVDPSAPECTRVTEIFQELVDAGVVDTRSEFDASFIQDVAHAGKVVMTIGPSYFGDFVIKPESSWGVPAGRIAAAPMPIWPGADDNLSGAWGGGAFTVSSNSKFPQAAADAAVWMVTAPEVQTEAPTFPAYGPANKLWGERVATDTYYAIDPYPAMAAQQGKISQSDRPVRYDFPALVDGTLAPAIQSGTPLQEAVEEFAAAVADLARASGYEVTD